MEERSEPIRLGKRGKTPDEFAASELTEELVAYGYAEDVARSIAHKYVTTASNPGLPTLRYMNMRLLAATIFLMSQASEDLGSLFADRSYVTVMYQKMYNVDSEKDVSKIKRDRVTASVIRYARMIRLFEGSM